MKLPIEFYNHLRLSLRVSDIVRKHVILTKKGGEYSGICPFHDEKTPSFTVNDQKKFYHCFGCGAHGDLIKFVVQSQGLSYREAAIKIAQDNNIELPKMSAEQQRVYEESDLIYDLLKMAGDFFAGNLDKPFREYMHSRGISDDTIKQFAIGYAPGCGKLERYFAKKSIPLKDLVKCGLFGKKEDGKIYEIFTKRIMFPIKNIYGKIVGFGGRAMGDAMPKYINSPETPVFKKSEVMFGENFATGNAYKSNYSILVEGYMDVIALHQAGFPQAVASLGTAVTEHHINKLWKISDEIISCLDGDNAGVRATSKVADLGLPLVSNTRSLSFVILPNGMDPDDFINSRGPDSFEKMLSGRIGLSEMLWKTLTAGQNFRTPEQRANLEHKLAEKTSLLTDHSIKTNYRRYFKDMMWEHIIKHKNTSSQGNITSSLFSVGDGSDYSELEFLERSICAFIIKFYDKIDVERDFNLQNSDLNEFKDFFIDTVIDVKKNNMPEIEELVKNTRFYQLFLLLSAANNIFLDNIFVSKEGADKKLIFEWLCKKHYFLLLKKEYAEVLTDDNIAQLKSASYLREIQKISNELNRLTETFIN